MKYQTHKIFFYFIHFYFVIVSFGPSPCDATIPAVYTRVAAYSDWVNKTIEDNGGL